MSNKYELQKMTKTIKVRKKIHISLIYIYGKMSPLHKFLSACFRS